MKRGTKLGQKHERVACDHCGGSVSVQQIDRHVALCPANPAVLAAVRSVLVGPAGETLNADRYTEIRAARPDLVLPHRAILVRFYGSWAGLTDRLGLPRFMTERERTGFDAPLSEFERRPCAHRTATEGAYRPLSPAEFRRLQPAAIDWSDPDDFD